MNLEDKSETFRSFSAQYNAQSRINNIHKIGGKNSLDVIGHTHTSRPCLSAIRHSGGVCGPSCGASQSVNSPFFFTAQKCAPAWQIISLTGLQHSHRPVRPIYSAPQEELTVKETRKLVCALELLHCATPPAAWETDEEEEKSARTFHLTYCMEPSNADMFKTSSLHKGSFYHFDLMVSVKHSLV